jgi:NAD(P)-dependent dehydrogenase (short-subunit alcohol dehydrogenase family)
MTSSHLGLSAIVTGGNSGIGRATAAKLMTEGAKVLVVDVQPEPICDITKRMLPLKTVRQASLPAPSITSVNSIF